LIVHILGADQLEQVAADVPEHAYRLIEAFWPGPLTLILPRHANVPVIITAELPTVAVRAPNHPVAEALIRAANVPIAAPSANRFAHTSPTTAKHVYDDLAGRVPLILDGGPTKIGVESTIVDMTGIHPKLLRPGAISLAALSAIVPDIELVNRYLSSDATPQRAPGQLMMHYAPMAELFLFEGEPEAVRSTLRQAVAEHMRHGRHPGLLIAAEDQVALAGIDVPIEVTGPLTDLDQVAKRLFAGLRALDGHKVDVILARGYPTHGIGLAIRDRLIRAAAGRAIMCA
jgi:L-threonylcarbamoyladenylate synthase